MVNQELVVQKALELSAQLKKLSTHQHLDLLHFFMVCMLFRKDTVIKRGGSFPRDFKLASWVLSIILCFSDSILSNLIIGEPVVLPFKKHHKILAASLIWYLVNYSPRDFIFRLAQLKLLNLTLTWFWTLSLIGKISSGVQYADKHFHNHYFIMTLLGVFKGSGHILLNSLVKTVVGINNDQDNVILYPSFQLKCSLFTAVMFSMFKANYFADRTPFVYLGVVFLYLYSSISSLMITRTRKDNEVQNEDIFSTMESVTTYLFFNNPLLNSNYADANGGVNKDEVGNNEDVYEGSTN